jgi:hypothetical protein
MAKKRKAKSVAKKRKARPVAKKRKAKPAKRKARARPKSREKPKLGVAIAGAGPPYKCETTLEPGVCLRFNRNPRTGQYNLPPAGERVNCTDCQYFFD